MIEVIVEDSGVGIKQNDQKKLFKMFGFLEKDEELNLRGVGLGLHLSKLIVEHNGGDILCKSKWGVGT